MNRKAASPAARRPRGAWPRAARAAAAVIATAALALLAAACSSSPPAAGSGGSADAGGSAASSSAVAYSRCMRSHGVPNFPDPTTNGRVPKTSSQLLGVSSSQLEVAQTACRHLYPSNGGSFQQSVQQCELTGDCPQAVVQQALNVMRKYARCMRSHGVPNWPDPTVDSHGRPFFDVSKAGLSHADTHSSLVESKDGECERQIGGSGGVPVPLG